MRQAHSAFYFQVAFLGIITSIITWYSELHDDIDKYSVVIGVGLFLVSMVIAQRLATSIDTYNQMRGWVAEILSHHINITALLVNRAEAREYAHMDSTLWSLIRAQTLRQRVEACKHANVLLDGVFAVIERVGKSEADNGIGGLTLIVMEAGPLRTAIGKFVSLRNSDMPLHFTFTMKSLVFWYFGALYPILFVFIFGAPGIVLTTIVNVVILVNLHGMSADVLDNHNIFDDLIRIYDTSGDDYP